MIRTLACSSILATVLTTNAAFAQTDTSYYAGGFVCEVNAYSTEWHFTKRTDGELVVRVFYQYVNGDTAHWIELFERNANGSVGLYDGNGVHRVALRDQNGDIHGEWLTGGPERECSSFVVSRSGDTQTRFEELFRLLESNEHGEETAATIGDLTVYPPIFAALPELDQQSFARRLDDLQRTYWQGYREHTADYIATAAVGGEGELAAFADEINSIFSGGMAADARADGYRRSKSLLVQAADRFVVNGGDIVSSFYVGSDRTCERLQDIFQHHRAYDFGKVEVAALLPADFWTRDVAEEILSTLRTCEGVPDDYARSFANNWADIEQRQPVVLSLLDEQRRLIALPATVETLIETRNLQPMDEHSSAARRLNQFDRFFGEALMRRRDAIQDIVIDELATAAHQLADLEPQAAAEVEDQCRQLGTLQNSSAQQRDEIRSVCREVTVQSDELRSADYLVSIEVAFADARAGEASADAAREICSEAMAAVSLQSGHAVRTACSENLARLASEEKAMQCELAVQASGASNELLQKTILASADRTASIEDLICSAGGRNMQISAGSEGMLMWQSHYLTIASGGNAPDLRLELVESETQADFEIAVTDETTIDQFQYFIVGPDHFAACLLGIHPACGN